MQCGVSPSTSPKIQSSQSESSKSQSSYSSASEDGSIPLSPEDNFVPTLSCRWLDFIDEAIEPTVNSELSSLHLGSECHCVHTMMIFEPFISKKVRRDLWELLDENGVNMIDEIPDTGVDGQSSIEWGVNYKYPTDKQIDFVQQNFQSDQKNKVVQDNSKYSVRPFKAILHKVAFNAQVKQAQKMKENCRKLDGFNNVGDVVQLPIHEVDQTKVDG